MAEHIKANTLDETCPKCGGALVEVIGPWGKGKKRDLVSGQHFAKVGCMGCKSFVRWSSWPDHPGVLTKLPGVDRCRSCGRPVVWTKTAKGKDAILDFCGPPQAVMDAEGALHIGRVSHFATCPNADQHRKKSQGDGQGGCR